MLSMYILLLDPANLKKKTSGRFANLVFIIMSIRKNVRLIARTPFLCSNS